MSTAIQSKMLSHASSCFRCWLKDCKCALLFPSDSRERQQFPAICLYLHHKELFSQTNTGHLIHDSSVFIAGDFNSENRLVHMIRQSKNPFVLFPAEAGHHDPTAAAAPDLLVVPDGTWSKATGLFHRLRSLVLPRPLPALGLYDLRASHGFRPQTQAHRISTIEAVSMVLSEQFGQAGRSRRNLDNLKAWKQLHPDLMKAKPAAAL